MRLRMTFVAVMGMVFYLIGYAYGGTDWCDKYMEQKEYDQAIKACRERIQKVEGKEYIAQAYCNLGRAYYFKKEYDKSIEEHTKAIELYPNYSECIQHRGDAFFEKREYSRAIGDYTRAIELGPKFAASAYKSRGDAYLEKKEYDRAVEDCTRAIELDPTFGNAYFVRGQAYHHKSQYDRAIEDYTKAIEKGTPAYGFRGRAFVNMEQFDRAIEDLSKAISLFPTSSISYINRGGAFFHKGQYDRAIEDFDKTIELASFGYLSRARAYAAKGQYDRAIEDYSKDIKDDPKYEYSYLGLIISSFRVSKPTYEKAVSKLKSFTGENESKEWIRTISKFYLGDKGVSESSVLDEARLGKGAETRSRRLCEAYYYLGEKRLMKGDRKGARDFFQRSMDAGKTYYHEFTLSKANLALMDRGKL